MFKWERMAQYKNIFENTSSQTLSLPSGDNSNPTPNTVENLDTSPVATSDVEETSTTSQVFTGSISLSNITCDVTSTFYNGSTIPENYYIVTNNMTPHYCTKGYLKISDITEEKIREYLSKNTILDKVQRSLYASTFISMIKKLDDEQQ